MTHFTHLLVACALTSFAGVTSAQDLSFNWHNLHNSEIGYTFSYQDQFALNAVVAGLPPGTGLGATNSVRLCYGIDAFQGGRNQGGSYEVTFARITQGAGLGMDITFGDVTISSAAADDLSGDACTSPLFDSDQALGGVTMYRDAGTLVIADGYTLPGTCGQTVDVYLDFSSSPVTGPNVFFTGSGPNTALMANVILEIQMPTVQFIDDPSICGSVSTGQAQYFVASITEYLGDNPTSPGGIADGNVLMGSALYGGNALTNNTLSPLRWTTTDANDDIITQAGMPTAAVPWQENVFSGLATRTPALWAVRQDAEFNANGIDGQGGADWNITNGDRVQLRLIDQLAGAEGYHLSKTAATGNPKIDQVLLSTPPVDTRPAFGVGALFVNFPVFIWSSSFAPTLLQSPFTWDSNPFLCFGLPETPGDSTLAPQPTTRVFAQYLGVNAFRQDCSNVADSVFSFMLNNSFMSIGTNHLPSWGPTTDGTSVALMQNGYGTYSYGMSHTNNQMLKPNASLAGVRLGVNAVGIQLSSPSFTPQLTEFSSGLTIQLH